jgi:hypothetical protein
MAQISERLKKMMRKRIESLFAFGEKKTVFVLCIYINGHCSFEHCYFRVTESEQGKVCLFETIEEMYKVMSDLSERTKSESIVELMR